MKRINAKARAIIEKMIAGLNRDGESRKIDNGDDAFLPVHISQVRTTKSGVVFSVAHYVERNGDLIADPEMEFLRSVHDGEFYPVSVSRGVLYHPRIVTWKEDGESIKKFKIAEQRDAAHFAGKWFRNIKAQQRL